MAKRRISEEERALLAEAMRAVTPIAKQKPSAAAAAPAEPRARRKPSAAAAPAKPAALPRRPSAAAPVRKTPASLAAIDRRTDQKLRRGQIEIDATLDLHGLSQSLAHRRLNAFLARAALEGHRKVLVITGKGRAREEGFMASERRGVLRDAVPRWIAEPPLCDLVWGLKPAAARHGGAGALYVLLRKVKRA